MKKIIATLLLFTSLSTHSLSPNEMFVVIGAVKYYNESCPGLNYRGIQRMNKALKRFDMDNIPVYILEQNPLAVSGYQTANKFGCQGTKDKASKAGYGQYIN